MERFVIIASGSAYVDPFVGVHRVSCDCPSVQRAVENRDEWSMVSATGDADARVQSARMVRYVRAVDASWSDCTLFRANA